MGVSIYYSATRIQPLAANEQVALNRLIAAYSVDDEDVPLVVEMGR